MQIRSNFKSYSRSSAHYTVFSFHIFSLKRLTLCLILFACCFPSFSQTPNFPSTFYTFKTDEEKSVYLKKVIGDSVAASSYANVPAWAHVAISLIRKNQNDTLLPWLYRYLGDAYENTKFDSAAHYYTKSLNAFKVKKPSTLQYLHQSILYAYMALNNSDSIRKYLYALEHLANKLPDSDKKKRNITNTIAQGYNSLNEYEKTIEAYRFVIQQSTLHKDSATMLNALVNLGNVYTEMDNYSMSIYYTLQALPFLKNDDFTNMVVYNNLGHYYQNLKKLIQLKFLYQKQKI